MSSVAKRLAFGALAVALLPLGTGCSTLTAGPQGPTAGDRLLARSSAAGVRVHAEEVFTVSRGTETVTVAPVAGWEAVPATALPNGVEFAFAYFSTAEPGVPAGYYKLRVYANPSGVGIVDGRVQLIDRAGRVTAQIPAQVEIHSMTVPEGATSQRTFVTAVTGGQGNRQGVWLRCPNGVCIRIHLFLPRIPFVRA